MKVNVVLTLTIALLLCAFGATAQESTHAGLFFTISNDCGGPVSGFAVGDKICLLQVGSAVFYRGIFQGTMVAGEKKDAMACTDKDGNAIVIFVPPPGTSTQAVVVTVKPDQVVSIPKTFCSVSLAAPGRQIFRKH